MKNADIIDNVLSKLKQFDQLHFVGFDGFLMGRFYSVTYDEIIGNYKSEKNVFLLLLKIIIRCFIRDYSYEFSSLSKKKLLLFYSHEHARRKDYSSFMEDILCLIDDAVILTGNDTKKKLVFSKDSFVNLLYLPKWFKTISKVEHNKCDALYLLHKVSMGYRWKKILDYNWDSCLGHFKGIITIFDAREYENILTQFARSKGVNTATLQHGYYPVQDKEGLDMAIPYTGFVSDQLWVWGNYCKENAVLSGMPPQKVYPLGYPKKILKIQNMSPINTGYLGVILDGGELLRPYNTEMISIAIEVARKHRYTIVLKPHPHDRYDYSMMIPNDVASSISIENIADYGGKVDFSICCASSCYIDLLALGCIVYRYVNPQGVSFYDRLDEKDSFSSLEDLECILQKGDKYINNVNRELLLGNSASVLENYKNAANKLISSF